MKLRYKILYMSFGAGLVVLGMVLNSLVSGDAEAQGSVKDARFGVVVCEGIVIIDGSKKRGLFGLSDSGDAILKMFGDDGTTQVAYLGADANTDEMIFYLKSKSKTDESMAVMSIDELGGRFDSWNNMGKSVAHLVVGSDGGGGVDTRDKFGYKR